MKRKKNWKEENNKKKWTQKPVDTVDEILQ